MAIRPYKSLPLISFLFCVFIWTYFQPAFRLQYSGVASKPWSAHQLAKSFYKEAFKAVSPKKESAIKVKVDLGFVDFLKRLFPQKKQGLNWKASAGLVGKADIPSNSNRVASRMFPPTYIIYRGGRYGERVLKRGIDESDSLWLIAGGNLLRKTGTPLARFSSRTYFVGCTSNDVPLCICACIVGLTPLFRIQNDVASNVH